MPETLMAESDRELIPTVTDANGAIELVGQSIALGRVRELVRRAAASEGAVLLTGEAGVAVESIAAGLHARHRHLSAPFVAVDCDVDEPTHLNHLLFGSTNGE